MSDDFGTVNLKRGERAREIEVLRQHYKQHREALARMTADAPTEHLASEYQRLIAEIDRALGKLDELEGVGTAALGRPPAPPPAGVGTAALGRPPAPPPPPPTSTAEAAVATPLQTPAERPLVDGPHHEIPPVEEERRAPIPLIIIAAILALAVIGGLVWWASRDGAANREAAGIDTVATDTADTVAPETAPPATPAALSITPASHDYGEIRKGTRAVREFEITNNTDEPVTITIARSTCRCLYYAHAPVVPPHAKESVSVTVDGARAAAGPLRETVKISAKSDPSVATSVDVIATVR